MRLTFAGRQRRERGNGTVIAPDSTGSDQVKTVYDRLGRERIWWAILDLNQ